MPPNPDSILDSVKKVIGLDSSDTSFDLDVTLFINSVFGVLKQLGVGADTGFIIQDNTVLWSQYSSSQNLLAMIKAYMSLQVKMNFDPPDGRYALPAFQDQIKQLEVRINIEAETINPPSDPFGLVQEAEVGVFTSYFAPKVVQLSFSSVITPDASKGNMFYLTLTGDCTINAPVSGSDGQHITVEITSAGHSVTWGPGWDFGDAGAPVLSTDGKSDIVSAYYKETAATWRAGFTTGF